MAPGQPPIVYPDLAALRSTMYVLLLTTEYELLTQTQADIYSRVRSPH